jgi:hypothetical protein
MPSVTNRTALGPVIAVKGMLKNSTQAILPRRGPRRRAARIPLA